MVLDEVGFCFVLISPNIWVMEKITIRLVVSGEMIVVSWIAGPLILPKRRVAASIGECGLIEFLSQTCRINR